MKWIILLIPLLAIAVSGWGVNLTVTVGETYIKYTWDEGYAVQVWHNGIYDFNTSLNYLTLANLKPSERHRLALMNQSNLSELLGDVTTETAMASTVLYVLIGVGLLFLVISIIYSPAYFSILTGLFSCLVFAVLSILIAAQNLALMYMAAGLAAIPLLMVIWNLYSIRTQVYM